MVNVTTALLVLTLLYRAGSYHSLIPNLGTVQRTITGLSDRMGRKTMHFILDLPHLLWGQSSTPRECLSVFLCLSPRTVVFIRRPVDVMEPALWLPFPVSLGISFQSSSMQRRMWADSGSAQAQWHEAHLEREV